MTRLLGKRMSKDTEDNIVLILVAIVVIMSFFSEINQSLAILMLGFQIIMNRAHIRELRKQVEKLEREPHE